MDIGTLTGSIEIEDQISSTLSAITRRVQRFAESYSDAAKTVALSGAAIIGAATGISGAIIALGNRGSDVNDVASTFQNFSGSVAAAAETMQQMREGTLGTVTDFDLMKSASKLLAGDVKLTSDEFGTLSKAAFILQNQGLGPTKDMLDLVSQAMLTGQTRSLQMKIGKIDLEKATKDYARSLGVEVSNLTQAGKVAATRIAILDAMNRKVREAGVQQRDFGEIMESVVVSVRNWGDELSKRVAASPSVIGAVTAIGDALTKAFGGSAEAALNKIAGWINVFADAVTRYAPPIIAWIGRIVDNVKLFYQRVLDYWDTVPDWFKNIAKEATITAGVIYLSSEALGTLTKTGSDTVGTLGSIGGAFSGVRDLVLSGTEVWTKWSEKLVQAGRNLMNFTTLVRQYGIVTSASSIAAYLFTAGLTAATTAMTSFAIAAGTLLLEPLSLIVIALGAVALGLRVLTGSWDFILTPMRAAGQVMRDVWVITTDLAETFTTELEPAISAVKSMFTVLGDVIHTTFTLKIQQARDDFYLLVTALSLMPQFREILGTIDKIHARAEDIRKRRELLTGPSYVPLAPPPLTTTMSSTSLGSVGPATRGGVSGPDLFKNDFADKVKALAKAWIDASGSSRVFSAAFASLTKAQRENYDVQAQLAPQVNQLIAAQKAVSPEMLRVRDAELATRLARFENNKTLLEASNLTEGVISRMKDLGMTEADIAGQYGVSTDSLSARIAKMQEATTRQEALAAFEHELVEQTIRDNKRKEEVTLASNRAIAEMNSELNDVVRQTTMTTTAYQIQKINEEAAARIAAFSATGASAEAVKAYSELVIQLSDEMTTELLTDTEALKNNSREVLQAIATRAKNTYDEMERHPEQYSLQTRKRFKQIAEDAQHAADGTQSAWTKTYNALGDVGNILNAIPGTFGEIGAMAARAGQAIMENLAQGNVFGAIVAGGTAAVGIITKLIGVSREGRREVEKFAESFDTLATGTGFDELHDKLSALGADGERLWIALTQGVAAGNKDAAEAAIASVQRALDEFDADLQHYNLSWQDMVNKQAGSTKAADDLAASYTRLTKAGYAEDAVLKAMNEDLNGYIVSAIRAGTKIPQSMQLIIEKFIRMGGLTEDARRALLGLADDGMPSLDAIRDAADRYGIKLDQLGGKVKQLEITELADQYVSDWDVLSKATDNWALLIEKMKPQVQSLVLDAIKYGSELPSSMKPMIQAFIDAGALIGDNGEKLTDLSQLKWSTPIEEMFETLIGKLDEFIDKLVGMNDITVRPKIEPSITYHENAEIDQPQYYSRGGTVVDFRPRGSDTVPAMLTPGERVIPRGGGGGRVVVELNKRWIAEEIVPEIPGVVKRMGIGR